MDFQWILPIRPKTPPSSAICSRPTRAFAARDEPHGSGKVTLALAQVMPGFASHHNRSPREKGRGTPRSKEGGHRKRPSSWYKRTHHPPVSPRLTELQASHNTTTTVWLFSSSACSVALPVFNGAADGTAQAKPASWPHSLPLLSPYLGGQDTHTHAQPTCRGADTHPDGHADDGPTGHMGTQVGAQMNAWMDSTHGWTLTVHRRCHTKPNLVPASSACVKDPNVRRPASRPHSIGASSPQTSTNIHMPMLEMQ